MNIFAISGLLIMITCSVMTLLMFMRGRERLHQIWGVFCITVFLWGLGVFEIATTSDPEQAVFWWKVGYIGVIFIPIMFTHFVYIFLKLKIGWYIYALYFIGLVFLILNLNTDLFINKVRLVFDQFYYISPPEILYSFFFILFIVFVFFSHVKLWQAFKKADGILKVQIKYFFLATFIGFGGGTLSFLPVFNIDLYPVFNLTVFLYPIIMGYAIFKHHLMNIRVIAAEAFSGLLVFITLVSVFRTSTALEFYFRIFMFIITVIFAIFLIQSVLREVRRREEMEVMAQKLRKASKKLATANKKLKKLDEAKSEFLSIASHQLRTPSTVIKGYISMMLEGSFGKIPKIVKENLEKVYISNERLLTLIENLLNISRIEAGRIQFDVKPINLVKIVSEVTEDFSKKVKEKKLKLDYQPVKNLPLALADPNKVKEVVSNIIDNAVKYTPKGEIVVGVHQESQSLVFSCQDTGAGVLSEDLPRLFEKFVRGQGMREIHTEGTGLGLYYARSLIENMGGRIWAESQGKGKGSKFSFSLPMADKSKAEKIK